MLMGGKSAGSSARVDEDEKSKIRIHQRNDLAQANTDTRTRVTQMTSAVGSLDSR